QDGVYRYDGTRFRRYGRDEGLPSTYITALWIGQSGDLWVGTERGPAQLRGDHFESVPGSASPAVDRVNGVGRDGGGTLWLATATGLFVQRDDGAFSLAPGWPGGEAPALLTSDELGTAVYAARGESVGRFDTGQWSFVESGQHGPWARIDALAVDVRGWLWARSVRYLFAKPPGASGFLDYGERIAPISNRGYLSLDRDGNLWVPTDVGVDAWDGERWFHLGRAQGVPTDWMRGVFEDREGTLWLTSLGVHRLVGRGRWWSWGVSEGLPNAIIWSILRDRRGRLIVGTGRGLCIATREGWRVVRGTERNAIRRVVEAADGTLWMGGSPAEVLRLDPKTHALRRYGAANGVEGRRIFSLLVDHTGVLWVATDGAGLLRWVPEAAHFVREQLPGTKLDDRISYVMEDRQGRLWATSELGLLVRDGGSWRRLGEGQGLKSDDVNYVIQDRDGDYWVAYFESLGVTHLRYQQDQVSILAQLGKTTGITDAKTYSMGEDLLGRLWIGTGNGLDIVLGNDVSHYDTSDGTPGDDFDAMAFLAQDNGDV
ncbi:MAG: two-component regulator propeller domain-containing protein, partial [Myxococcota bacterium]